MERRTQTTAAARHNGRDGYTAPIGELRGTTAPATTYYGRPMVKRATWRWFIGLYFFIGGLGAGAALIGALADLFGGERHRATVRHARWAALVVSVISPILLIIDLGRPARFYRMLRIVKFSSPLNLGTYILTTFGVLSGALVAKQAAEDGLVISKDRGIGRLTRFLPAGPLEALQAIFGLGLGGYTGVLLAVTAIPLWAAGGVLLGPLFLSTAIASGASLVALLNVLLNRHAEKDQARAEIELVATAATVAQLGTAVAREVMVPPEIGKPLASGTWGTIYRVSALGAGMIGPLAARLPAQIQGKRVGRTLSATAATLSVVGALAERMALLEAGHKSADDPLAYQALTAGKPGEARPTPQEQAARAPQTPPFKAGQVAPERTGPTEGGTTYVTSSTDVAQSQYEHEQRG